MISPFVCVYMYECIYMGISAGVCMYVCVRIYMCSCMLICVVWVYGFGWGWVWVTDVIWFLLLLFCGISLRVFAHLVYSSEGLYGTFDVNCMCFCGLCGVWGCKCVASSCAHVCVYVFVCVCVCVCVHVHVCLHVHVCVRVLRVHVCVAWHVETCLRIWG